MTTPLYYQYVFTYMTHLEKAVASVFSGGKSVYKLYRGPLILVVSINYHKIQFGNWFNSY